MNQNQRVLNHLIDHGYITSVIANNYGIRRLASRIHDLKQEYVNIKVETRTDDVGSRYAYYSMSDAARLAEREDRTAGYDYRSRLTAPATEARAA